MRNKKVVRKERSWRKFRYVAVILGILVFSGLTVLYSGHHIQYLHMSRTPEFTSTDVYLQYPDQFTFDATLRHHQFEIDFKGEFIFVSHGSILETRDVRFTHTDGRVRFTTLLTENEITNNFFGRPSNVTLEGIFTFTDIDRDGTERIVTHNITHPIYVDAAPSFEMTHESWYEGDDQKSNISISISATNPNFIRNFTGDVEVIAHFGLYITEDDIDRFNIQMPMNEPGIKTFTNIRETFGSRESFTFNDFTYLEGNTSHPHVLGNIIQERLYEISLNESYTPRPIVYIRNFELRYWAHPYYNITYQLLFSGYELEVQW